MSYEINKVKIIERIINLYKMSDGIGAVRLFVDDASLRNIDSADILGFLLQFEKSDKLLIKDKYFGSNLNIKGPWDLFKEPRHYIEIEKIDMNYFEEEYLKTKHLIEGNNNLFEKSEFYIVYTAERKIMLNGKIEIAQPDFNSENDLVFKYLYDHSDTVIQISDLKLKTKMSKSIDKVLANLGFVKGLRSTFFDINKSSIKFKKKVTL